MSETGQQDSNGSARAAIRADAAAWFARANSGLWSVADQEQLDGWLAQSSSHRAAYWRLEGAWQEAARLTALRPLQRRATSPRFRSLLAKAVAAAVVLVGLSAVTFAYRPVAKTETKASTFVTAVGDRRVLKLTDGSRIELNTDTVLRLAIADGKRKAWLVKGEAFFNIRHDAAHPFEIVAGNERITDLGTQFLVRQHPDRLEVALLEGRARIDSDAAIGGSQSAELTPGDVAVASGGSIAVSKKSARALTDEASWRRGVLVFEGISLADAAAEMNRYNAEQLVIADPTIGRRPIDGTFPVHAVQQFSEMAQAVFRLRTEKRGNLTIISR